MTDPAAQPAMPLGKKLQLKPTARIAVLGEGPRLDLAPATPTEDADAAEALLAFVTRAAELDAPLVDALLAAADGDRLVWVAYPKAGQLGTDLNRDRLAAALTERGLRPVRQVAIDDTWSALRFRR